MDQSQIREIAIEACREEHLPWTIASVSPKPDNGEEWEIHYDAWGKKYHKILIRIKPEAGSTRELLIAEVRWHLSELKQSGRL